MTLVEQVRYPLPELSEAAGRNFIGSGRCQTLAGRIATA